MNATTRILPVPLTEDELLELGDRIATLEVEIEQQEAEKKALVENYNGVIKSMNADALAASKTLKGGTKDAEVNCEWYLNEPEEGKKTLKRLDTFEVIEIMEMDLLDSEAKEPEPMIDTTYEVVDDTVNPDDEVNLIADRQEAETTNRA